MESESNHQQAGSEAEPVSQPRKPYRPPVLSDYGAASDETKAGHKRVTAADHGSS